MVEHILLMQWTNEATQQSIDNALVELRGLKDKIPGIVDLSCGADFSERAKSYTHGLVIRFKDRAALEAYFPHPEHKRVVQNFIDPIRADTVILDYEI
ncbi:MAG TPA: Dabb family protein [Blastocatellia bacterium]|nr:Dabb family protein [Blastocatellia bacterium]